MLSNLMTELLSRVEGFEFNFDDPKAYSKLEQEKSNQAAYIIKLIEDYQKIAINLKYIEFKEALDNPNILLYKFEALKEQDKNTIEIVENFREVFKRVIENNKEEYFDKIEIDGKKILDFSFDEATAKLDSIIKELDSQTIVVEEKIPEFLSNFMMMHNSLLDNIQNNRIINSQTLNLALGGFPLLFIKELISELIKDDKFESFIGLFDFNIDPDDRDIVVKKIKQLTEEIYNKDDFSIFFKNISKETLNNGIQKFLELFSDKELTSENSMFLYISNYIDVNKTLLEEFAQNYFERFGNLLSLPLADLLQNAIVQSDEDLETFCKVSGINMSDFIVDVRNKIKNDFYQKYSYTTAIELDKKINNKG